MKAVVLYSPNGDKEGVTPHPSKIEEMKAKGWAEKSITKTKTKTKVNTTEKEDGKS